MMSEQNAKRPHDVFISYASENKAVADAIVADFEQNGIRCWYAPRDIRAGANYLDALVGAIKDAEVIVLVYSDKSNESKYVLHEISVAFEEGKTIVPFRLADIQMGNALSFCLKGVHWMDATTPPLLKNITTLREHVCSIIPDKTDNRIPVIKPETKEIKPWWGQYRIQLVAAVVVVVGLSILLAIKAAVSLPPNDDKVVNSNEATQKEDNNKLTNDLTQKPTEGPEDSDEEQETTEDIELVEESYQNQEAAADFGENTTAQSARTSDSDGPMELADTWEQIITAGKDGTYKDKYQIGDTKELDMGSEGVITMKLVAMDEDDLADGSGKAPMTWVADELLQSEHTMNDILTNEGGWEETEMRRWLRNEILPLMPEEVQNNIRKVTKYSYSHEKVNSVKTEDTIWIPSVREVLLEWNSGWVNKYYEDRGAAYTEVFKSFDSSRERGHVGEPYSSWWWLRSAFTTYDDSFFSVLSDGGFTTNCAWREGGVVIGFCL